MSSVQLVRAAMRSLIRQGYRDKFTLKQLMLELRLLAENSDGEASDDQTFEWQELR